MRHVHSADRSVWPDHHLDHGDDGCRQVPGYSQGKASVPSHWSTRQRGLLALRSLLDVTPTVRLEQGGAGRIQHFLHLRLPHARTKRDFIRHLYRFGRILHPTDLNRSFLCGYLYSRLQTREGNAKDSTTYDATEQTRK